MNNVKVALVAITKHGAAQLVLLAPKMPETTVIVSEKFGDAIQNLPNEKIIYSGALRAQMKKFFEDYEQIIFFVSLGAVVRLIAPHLKSKDVDPGILVVDDAGQFVIPVLSGHVGGANAFAERLALLIGGVAVVTTASDVGKTIPVDILGRELGWKVEAPKINITRVSADVVNEESIAFVQDVGSKNWWTRSTPLPKNIHLFDNFDDVDINNYKSVLWVTHDEIDPIIWADLKERLVVYRPPVDVKNER